MSLSSVLCVCLAASLFPAISALNRHQLELKEHYEHLARIASFECDSPQPRLLTVHDILSDYETHGKAYFPEVTVLHRCDRYVGACNDATYRCGPTDTVNISMPFKVTFLEDKGEHVKGSWLMEYHDLENHTYCGCHKAHKPTHTSTPVPLPHETFSHPQENTSYQNVPGHTSPYDVHVPLNNPPQHASWNEADQHQNVPGNTGPYNGHGIVQVPVNNQPQQTSWNEADQVTPSQSDWKEDSRPDEQTTISSPSWNEIDYSTTPEVPSTYETKDIDAQLSSEMIRFGDT